MDQLGIMRIDVLSPDISSGPPFFSFRREEIIYIYIYRMMIRFMIHSCDSHFDFEESENKRELYAGRYLKMYTYIELDSRV